MFSEKPRENKRKQEIRDFCILGFVYRVKNLGSKLLIHMLYAFYVNFLVTKFHLMYCLDAEKIEIIERKSAMRVKLCFVLGFKLISLVFSFRVTFKSYALC